MIYLLGILWTFSEERKKEVNNIFKIFGKIPIFIAAS